MRQIVKSLKSLKDDAANMRQGADEIKTVANKEGKGNLEVITHSDGTTVSIRSFSGRDGKGPPTIQVNNAKAETVTKVRYEN